MPRLSRFVMATGIIALVFGTRWLHTEVRGEIAAGLSSYVALAAILIAVSLLMGLPDEPTDWQPAIFAAGLASVVGAAVVAVVRLFQPDGLPRFVLLVTAAALVPWLVVCWRVALRGHARVRGRERVVAVLDATDINLLQFDAQQTFPAPEEPFTLVATVAPMEAASGGLVAVAAALEATLLVLGPGPQLDSDIVEQAELLHRGGVRVRTLDTFYDQWFGKVVLTELSRMALLTDVGALHDRRSAGLKRALDLVLAVLGVATLLVVVPVVLVGNLVGNRGPLLFRQQRVGLNGEPFRILKFRTMTPAAADAREWTAREDGRITRFGRVLRRTHLDELPQVINVLRGTLSIVGPRPEQVHYVGQLEQALPFYAVRHIVKPGITGWAQVKFRYGASERDAAEKLQYDLHYVRHHTLIVDLRIMSRTIRQMLFARGR